MIESFLITSRETLEASLVVGIVLAYLGKTENNKYRGAVFWAIAAGVLFSIFAAIGFTVIAGGFEGTAEALFEGITMLVGAALLTTMIMWMMQQRHITAQIESKVAGYVANPSFSYLGIFLLVFVAIIREGVETVIFMNAINYASGINFVGGLLGITVAIGVGYLFFHSARKMNLKKIFTFSSILLILFAAGLTAHGVHELEEAGVLTPFIYPLYDINPILNEKGIVGSFLKGLFGYNGNPSLLEVICYWLYLLSVGGWWYTSTRNATSRTQ
ncbi:MAG: FTR1 family protein [Candidatus Woesearchaeota archaeon]|nr:FTR1 family protein [Candidatus Woesearchaeota archaeon]